jgi:hypothetical protein
MLALGGQPGVDPILLAFGIITHVRVSERHQFTGSVF